MGITIRVSTKNAVGPAFSDWTIWSYNIHNPEGFNKGEQVAIDVPGDTDVMAPEAASQLEGAPIYDLDGQGGAAVGCITTNKQTDVEICFVAKKGAGRRGDIGLRIKRSRQRRNRIIPDGWELLPFDGGSHGIGKHWLPPASIVAPTASDGNLALLAERIQTVLTWRRRLIAMVGPANEAA
jgi:hypothetical protein